MISQKSIDLIEKTFLGHVKAQNSPVLHATCGIPGAGKSTFVDQKLIAGDFPADAYIFNPDRVMLSLPEYQADTRALSAQKSYQKWELPARDLAYGLADRAGAMNAHIIKDMGCANPLSLELVKALKAKGYAVRMYHIDCDMDEAFRRIDQREFRISRAAVQNRYELLDSLLPEYRALADEFHHLDNTNLDVPFQIVT